METKKKVWRRKVKIRKEKSRSEVGGKRGGRQKSRLKPQRDEMKGSMGRYFYNMSEKRRVKRSGRKSTKGK